MKFKIDENLPGELADEFRAAGHVADTVYDEGLSGASEAVMACVQAEGRAILTLDKGIADIRKYPPGNYAGLILLRPRTNGRAAILAFVRRYLATLLQLPLSGHLYIVTETGIRVR